MPETNVLSICSLASGTVNPYALSLPIFICYPHTQQHGMKAAFFLQLGRPLLLLGQALQVVFL